MPLVVNCAGCDRPINDQYLYNVLDRAWHQTCIQCSDCKTSLNEKCFSRDGKLYCRDDFFRRYGPRCSGCHTGICPSDLVRRARDKVYHLNCFACYICRKPIGTGEQLFFVDDHKFMCKHDYVLNKALVSAEEGQEEEQQSSNMLKSPPSAHSNALESSGVKYLPMMHHGMDSMSSSSSSPSLIKHDLNQSDTACFQPCNTSTPPLNKQQTTSQVYMDEKENLLLNNESTGVDYMHQGHHYQLGHVTTMHSNGVGGGGGVVGGQGYYAEFMDSDKDENQNSDDELIEDDEDEVDDDDEEDEDGTGDRTHGSNGKASSSSSSKDDSSNMNGKKRGPRTTIKAKQLEMLKSAFAATPKPTRHIREQLAQETGLNMRVIQVWFQNRRSKERRMKQLSAMGNRRHYYRNAARQHNAQNLSMPIQPPPISTSHAAQQPTRPYDLDQNEFANSNQPNAYINHSTDFYGNNTSYEYMTQPSGFETILNPVMDHGWSMA